MTKSSKLMHVEFLVTSEYVYDILAFAEVNRIKLYNLNITAASVTHAGNGATPVKQSMQARSVDQQGWIVKNIKGEFAVKELLDKWEGDGFPRGSFYAAIGRAVDHKILKKVKVGVYKLVAKG